MGTIAQLVDRYAGQERPLSNVLDTPTLYTLAIAATRDYSGYGALKTHLDIPIADPVPDPPVPYPEIDELTELTVSEWAVIKPLFILYVERETAIQLEASRDSGIDPFGRSVSEVDSAIEQYLTVLPEKAFYRGIETV